MAPNATVVNVTAIALAEEWEKNGFYRYEPSYPTAIVGAVLFSITGICTIIQYFYYKTWFFWCMFLAAVMQMVGFIARAPSAHDPTNRPIFIMQFCLIILAPAVMAASLYMTFGRIIFWTTPAAFRGFRHLWVPARFITPIFVCFDIVSFGIQLIGAAMISAADAGDFEKMDRGGDIVKIGLAVQLVCFGFFTFVGLRFVLAARGWVDGERRIGWRQLAWAVNVGCALILIRSIYRMAEFTGGHDTFLQTHEVWFWVLDALLMWLTLVLFNIYHPGMFLPNFGFRKQALDQEEIELGRNAQ